MALNPEQIKNLTLARASIIKALDKMIRETSQRRVKALYSAVRQNVMSVPINFRLGSSIERGIASEIRGQNVKRIVYQNGIPKLQSAIIMPHNHFFSGSRIKYDGLLTLMHEYSHIVLPEDVKYFAVDILGIKNSMLPDEIDEFLADLVMVRLSKIAYFPQEIVTEW